MVDSFTDNCHVLGMTAYIKILMAIVVILHLMSQDVPLPQDVVEEMVLQTIEEYDSPPLTGRRRRRVSSSASMSIPIKRPRIKYDYLRAEECVMADWVGDLPRFPDKQFERTFRIKPHMVDIIINHIARRNTFWIKTVCRAGRETINPYVKFLCAMKMLCYGVSASAFLDYHQFSESTARRCVHHFTSEMQQRLMLVESPICIIVFTRCLEC